MTIHTAMERNIKLLNNKEMEGGKGRGGTLAL